MKPRIIEGPFYFTRHATGEIAAKLPELHRAATFERAEIDTENRVVPVVFATEAPVDRWFGRERLVCTPDACNISRANNLGAFLSEHQRDKQIGVIVAGSTTFGADRKARAKLRFSKNSALAEQEWKDLQDGNRGLFSVGYVVHRLVLAEEDDEKGDMYEARDWEVLEISLVSIPADANCTIDGRSETEDKHHVIIQAETTMLNRSRTTFARFMAPDTGANPQTPTPKDGEGQRAQPQPEVKIVKEIDEADRERCRELSAIGTRYGCTDEMEKFIKDGSPVDKGLRYVMDNELRPVKAGQRGNSNQSPMLTGNGNTGDGSQDSPMSGVISARSLVDVLNRSEGFKQYMNGASGSKRTFGMEIPALQIRATFASTGIPTGSASVTELPFVPAIETRLTIADIMGSGEVSTATVHYMLETAPTNAATAVAEGGLKPEATFAFTDASVPVRKVAVIARVNDEALADYPFLRSYFNNKLSYMIREREEALVLSGDGIAPNPTGILNTSGIQTQAKGADSNLDAIHKAITKIRVTGQADPDGLVMHPNDAQLLFLAKDSNGQYLAGGPFYAPYGNGPFAAARRVWGLPLVETTAITQGTALVGAFRAYSAIYRRSGITIETTNSDGDDFKYNRTAIRVEERIAVVVERPSAFCTVTGIA